MPLDGSKLAECVLPHVEAFASDCQVSTIIFVRVIEPAPLHLRGGYATNEVDFSTDFSKIQQHITNIAALRKSSAEVYLCSVINRIKPNGAELKGEVIIGATADKLIEYAEVNQIDLILIATHGRSGLSRWVRGSIADRILRAAHIPVLMVRAPGTAGKPEQ